MTKRQRVAAALAGEAVDRVPVSFWWHDFVREWSAEGLAAAMLESVERYDFDYLKVNPRATYYAEAWGCAYRASGDPARQPATESWVLHEASDLASVRAIDGTAGPFAEQLEALRLIGEGLRGEVPFVQTVFSPLSVLGRMADGREPVQRWMTEAPDALHSALDAVTETLAAYSSACIAAGADGIFFATTEWATSEALTPALYETFGRSYDLRVLDAVQGASTNILHVCRPNNMLSDLLNYPVAAVNWAVHAPGNASFASILPQTPMALMGGVDERHALLSSSPDDVRGQVRAALAATGGRRFLLGGGCSISPQTPPANIEAAVAAVREAPP